MYKVAKLITPSAGVKSLKACMVLTNAFCSCGCCPLKALCYYGRIIDDQGKLLITHRTVHVWERVGWRGLYHSEMREQELRLACAFCSEIYLKRKPKLFFPSQSMRARQGFFILKKSNEGNLLLIFVSASQAEPPAIFW